LGAAGSSSHQLIDLRGQMDTTSPSSVSKEQHFFSENLRSRPIGRPGCGTDAGPSAAQPDQAGMSTSELWAAPRGSPAARYEDSSNLPTGPGLGHVTETSFIVGGIGVKPGDAVLSIPEANERAFNSAAGITLDRYHQITVTSHYNYTNPPVAKPPHPSLWEGAAGMSLEERDKLRESAVERRITAAIRRREREASVSPRSEMAAARQAGVAGLSTMEIAARRSFLKSDKPDGSSSKKSIFETGGQDDAAARWVSRKCEAEAWLNDLKAIEARRAKTAASMEVRSKAQRERNAAAAVTLAREGFGTAALANRVKSATRDRPPPPAPAWPTTESSAYGAFTDASGLFQKGLTKSS